MDWRWMALVYLYDAASASLNLAASSGAMGGQWLVDACRSEGARRLTDGLVGWAVSTGQVLCEPDIRLDPRWPYHDPADRPASVLILPIPGHRRAVGALQLVTFERNAFSPADVRTVQVFASLFGQAVDRAQLAVESQEALWTDTLTGVKSANYLGPFLDRCLESPTGQSMAVAFFDGDNLKAANDRFGHESGNRLIRHIASSLAGATRPQDVLIRYAGDEFILFMPATTIFEARPVLDRMRHAVQAAPVHLAQGPFRVSVSGGVAEVQPGQDPFVALRAAEREMYRAKREGKNRVAGEQTA
jgi:diguanylate cyclase (GGDEF)-like protein